MKKNDLRIIKQNREEAPVFMRVKNLNVWMSQHHILRNFQTQFYKNQIHCIVGPSGSGKSTFLRSINRMNDGAEGYKVSGEILWGERNILQKNTDTVLLRRQIGMVFQKPCVFPRSLFENVLFGVQNRKKLSSREIQSLVEEKLKEVSLWNEVSHRLDDFASSLSQGQQQRLCIARTLAVEPQMILLDEPTSSLDPVSTKALEDLLVRLKKHYTIVVVTHNIMQARRIADRVLFVCNGEIIEEGSKDRIFQSPGNEKTKNYLNEEYCDC